MELKDQSKTQGLVEHMGTVGIWFNISLVVEFQWWWVVNSKTFGQGSAYSKENLKKKSVNEWQFDKKCQNGTFRVNFWCQKSTEFKKKMNSNLGDQFLLKTFFSSVNFWTGLLLKSCPIFDKLTFIDRI